MSTDLQFDLLEATSAVCRKPRFGWNFLGLDEVDSTNNYSKEHGPTFVDPTIIVSRNQTAGRGRGGKTWETEGPNTSFLSTWSMYIDEQPDPRWTLGIGLYVFESLGEAFPALRLKLSLKAPNDIYLADRKLAGLLVEATTQAEEHFIHVGLGMNVFATPLEHAQTATCLNTFLGGSLLTPEAWQEFIENFGTSLMHLEKRVQGKTDEWLKKISPRLINALNKNPAYTENPVTAIDPDGSLVLERGKINWKDL